MPDDTADAAPSAHGQPDPGEDQRGEPQPADAGASEDAAGAAEELDREG